MSADEALQQLVGVAVLSVAGTWSTYDPDECYDFRIVTDKGALIGYVTNGEGIAMEWRPAP